MLLHPLEKIYKRVVKLTPFLIKDKYLFEAGLKKDYPTFFRENVFKSFPLKCKKYLCSYSFKNERDKRIFFELCAIYIDSKLSHQQYELIKALNQPIEFNGKKITLQKLQNLILTSSNSSARECLFNLFIDRLNKINPLLESLFVSRWRILKEEFNFKTPLEFYKIKKNINYTFINSIFNRLSTKLNSLYIKNISNWIKNNKLTYNRKEKPKICHAVLLIQLDNLKSFYSSKKLFSAFFQTLENLGFLEKFKKSVFIDYKDRVKKTPRAACFGVCIPNEIYIVIRKIDGYNSYRQLFHEGGHAVFLSNISQATSFYNKYWPKSGASFELPAFLFESLIRNPVWLKQILKLSEKDIKEIVYYTTLSDLYLLKRYLGKFFYEYSIYKDGLENFSSEKSKSLYSRIMEKETKFSFDKAMYLYDIDPGIYSADYIRAWIGKEQLMEYLKDNFGSDWFTKKSAGRFLKKLWKRGFKKDMEELLKEHNIGREYDYKPLVRKYQHLLNG